MKILDYKDAINRRLYNNQSFVLTAIHRVFCLNRTVLQWHQMLLTGNISINKAVLQGRGFKPIFLIKV
jgi:hypothetical protein